MEAWRLVVVFLAKAGSSRGTPRHSRVRGLLLTGPPESEVSISSPVGTVDCIPLTMDCTAVHVDQLGA